jgi:putative chitinase
MTKIITPALLAMVLPKSNGNLANVWADHLSNACDKYQINTPKRVAMFLAQVLHESGNLSRVEENLNYTAGRLVAVFPKYFRTLEYAQTVVGNPSAIARRVYGGRMGNGAAPSNDGYSYRGRGLIQLTGKANYKAASDAMGVDFVNHPGLLCEPSYAASVAGWFFSAHGCNQFADRDDVLECTKAINGGMNGLEDRKKLWVKCTWLLCQDKTSEDKQ